MLRPKTSTPPRRSKQLLVPQNLRDLRPQTPDPRIRVRPLQRIRAHLPVPFPECPPNRDPVPKTRARTPVFWTGLGVWGSTPVCFGTVLGASERLGSHGASGQSLLRSVREMNQTHKNPRRPNVWRHRMAALGALLATWTAAVRHSQICSQASISNEVGCLPKYPRLHVYKAYIDHH